MNLSNFEDFGTLDRGVCPPHEVSECFVAGHKQIKEPSERHTTYICELCRFVFRLDNETTIGKERQ